MRKLVIVGAGAMGCLFAARLGAAGAEVTLVDVDEARLAALRAQGVTLADDAGERTVPVNAALARDVSAPVDLVMLFTKGMHSAAAIRSVAHLAGPETYAITLQNGLGNAEAIAEVFAADRILIGVTDFPADLEAPTRVSSHGPGRIWLGGPQPAAEAVAALFRAGGMQAEVDRDVWVQIWEKVAFNAALNAVATITGFPVAQMNAAPTRRIASAVIREAAAVAASKGIAIDVARVDAKVDFGLMHHGLHRPSMLQDLLAGRPTEIETINGAIVRAAEAAGLAAPVTATLAELVRLVEERR